MTLPGKIKKMSKKIVWLVLLLVFLSGCSRFGGSRTPETQPDETPAPSREKTSPTQPLPTYTPYVTPSPTAEVVRGTLTIWHSWKDDQAQVLDQILEDFQALYPDVLLDVLYIPRENMKARFEAAVQEGGGPDILFGAAEWGAELFQAGLTADMSELVDMNLLNTINPPALDSVRFGEALIGIPYAQEGVVLYRNKALVNSAAATFDELVSLAQTATQGEIIGADLEQSFFFSGAHLNGIGGRFMDQDGMPAFNNDAGVAWLELVKSLGQAGPTEDLSDNDLDLFKQGRVGWIIDGVWNLAALSAAIGTENLAIDPWPTVKDGALSGFLLPANLYLSATSQNDDRLATRKFVEFFISPEVQARLFEAGMIPVVRDIKTTEPGQQLILSQALAALEGNTAYPTLPEMQVYQGPLEAAIQSVLFGDVTPAQALTTAEQAIQAALAALKPSPTPNP